MPISSFYICSSCWVTQSCLTLCDPMDCSMQVSLSLISSWSLLKVMSIELLMASNHLILCCPFSSCLQYFPASGSLPMSWLFTSGGQSIGNSASASVLPMNTQGWFPLGLTGLISLQSKWLSRVFPSTRDWKHQFFSILLGSPFFVVHPSLWFTLTSIHGYWKNHSFDYMDLCRLVFNLQKKVVYQMLTALFYFIFLILFYF